MKDDALFYTCSLIEYIGRSKKRSRSAVVDKLGKENLKRIYRYAEVLHCEPIEKIADEYIHLIRLRKGTYDNIAACKYLVPDYWAIGSVYSRLIEDVQKDDVISALVEVYHSKLSEHISDYNSAICFQPRDYLREQYIQEKSKKDDGSQT